MLVEFLQTNRGIAFRTMVNAKDYPQDAMPFYAQSYTAAEYLIARGGRKRYIAFVEMGIQTNDWSKALQQYYGYENLAQFQNVWLTWVSNQFPTIDNDLMRDDIRLASVNAPAEPNEQYARVARPEPNLMLRTPVSTAHPNSVMEASYVAATPAPQQSAPRAISTLSEPLPQPTGVWDEISPASYNEIAPAAVEAAPAPRAKLNWLPGDVIPLNVSPQNVQR